MKTWKYKLKNKSSYYEIIHKLSWNKYYKYYST